MQKTAAISPPPSLHHAQQNTTSQVGILSYAAPYVLLLHAKIIPAVIIFS
jgi:hypothetical protein